MGQPPADTMISHWWWRPGWSPGKAFYTWHVTFDELSPMARLAALYRPALSRLPELDVLTTDQLHMTMQGIGFTHEVDGRDVAAIVAATRTELAALPAPTVEVGRPYVDRETVQAAVLPVAQIADLRRALRRGIAAVWGDQVPESMEDFRPHVTLAYSNAEQDRSAVAEAVASIDAPVTQLRVSRLSLIRLHRDNTRYEWDELNAVPIGGN